MILRWFISSAHRHGYAAHRHYRHLLEARRDGLSPEGIAAVQFALNELWAALVERQNGRIRIKAEELQFAANRWISPYPHSLSRSAVELILVALTMALAIRTFFLEPFRIPTGSMQPTLYGISYEDWLGGHHSYPGFFQRVNDWFGGFSYVYATAPTNGFITKIDPVVRVLGIGLYQSIWIGDTPQKVWFPPDLGDLGQGIAPRLGRSVWFSRRYYHAGDEVIFMRQRVGDFLLADRLTYNFRKPARGEIVVFKTSGISEDGRQRYSISPDEFYIKRLVGLPGERVQIGNDHHLIIDGRRLEASAPHFGKLYSFSLDRSPRSQPYFGHLNGFTAAQYLLRQPFAPLFPEQDTVFTNDPGSYLVMGDNTADSLDSRYWGELSGDAIVGKCFFVFWPLSSRWGWRDR